MNMHKSILATWILVIAATFTSSETMVARNARSPSPLLILKNVQVIDVRSGKVVGPRTVLVADGRIAAIQESGEIGVPPGARTLDGSGKYLIPGLMDLMSIFSITQRNDNLTTGCSRSLSPMVSRVFAR